VARIGTVGQGFVVQIAIRTRVRADVARPLRLENMALLDSPNGGRRTSEVAVVTVPGPLMPTTGAAGPAWGLPLLLGLSLLILLAALAFHASHTGRPM